MSLRKQIPKMASLVVILSLFFSTKSSGQIQFNDISTSAGLTAESVQSPSSHGLGANWIDYDKDGWPDLFVPDGDGPAHLFRNEGNGTFSTQSDLLPALPNVEMTGSVFADYDNDGDEDIYITVGGATFSSEADAPPNFLLKNMWVENGGQVIAGTPLFEDVAAAAGVDNLAPIPFGEDSGYMSFTAGWLDYDRDGCVDLYVGNMLWNAGGTEEAADALYKNNCDGTFTNATVSSNMNPGDPNLLRPTLAFFGGHLNTTDIDPDMYLVNVHDNSPYYEDLIYFNNGDGTFTEVTSSMPGIGDDSGSGMGIDVADINLDGNWDIFVTDLPAPANEPGGDGNMLYMGKSDGTWEDDNALAAGLATSLSWGAVFMDLDHDGFEELFIGNNASQGGSASLFQNNQDGTFTDITDAGGIVSNGKGRGAVYADFDRDGDLDFVKVRVNKTIQLFENVSSNQGNWIEVVPEATVSNRSAIGTLVEVTAGGLSMMRQIVGGSSAHSQNELLLHFGLDDATIVDELKVSWPSGQVTIMNDVAVNQLLTITEGGNAAPNASFTHTVSGMMVDVDGTGSSDDGVIVSWDWNFGDGNTGSGSTASHDYTADGSYTVTLTVTDDEGATDSASQTIDIGNPAPVASFTFITSDLMADFDGTGSTDDGTIVSWDWDLGDGNVNTGSTISHSYAAAGTYSVSLTVTDDLGKTGSTSEQVTVSEPGTGGQMHIENITTTTIRAAGVGFVEATVLIVDENGTPVETATVSGVFSEDLSGSDSGVTNASGEVVLVSDDVTTRPQNLGICVETVTHATLTYDPAANSDPGYACTEVAPSRSISAKDRMAAVLDIPDEYALHSNYPNPFNPTTTIDFDVPEATTVRLDVYDMMGRRIATLVNGQMAAGRYEASWNATSDTGASLASGVYLYRMQAGAFESVQRMVLMK